MSDRQHHPSCPTVNSPLAALEACTCPPPTPQLDLAREVRDVSEQIGDFVMEHLRERGYVISRWIWEQRPCNKVWGQRADGSYVEISPITYRERSPLPGWVKYDEVEVDPFDCPCGVTYTVDAEHPTPNPYPHAHWSLVQHGRTEAWMREELAAYFGIDYDELGREQMRLLDHLREEQRRLRDRHTAEIDAIRDAQSRGAAHDEPTAAAGAQP